MFRADDGARPACACPWSRSSTSVARGRGGARRRQHRAAGDRPARRSRWAATAAASRRTETELAPGRLRGPRREPDQPGAGRGVGARLGRVRARGDARPQRQRRDRLLDRERRPDGRPHRRLGHGRAAADAHRPRSTRSCATRRSRVIRAVGVETGGSNVQFAVNPETGEIVVIEMNPRVSRSSALASKATGFPIAKIAAQLAVGYALEEIPNDITRRTPASFEPTIDYVVIKMPALRVREVPRRRGPALDPHEVGRRGDGDRAHLPRGVRQGDALARARRRRPSPRRRPSELLERARDALRRPLRPDPRGASARGVERRASSTSAPRSTPGSCASCEALATEGDGTDGLERTFKLGRHLRRRVRGARRPTTTRRTSAGSNGARRGRARRPRRRS